VLGVCPEAHGDDAAFRPQQEPIQHDRHALQRQQVVPSRAARARKVLGWPKRCELDHAFRREYSYERRKLAQLQGQLGVFLTRAAALAARLAPAGRAWAWTLESF
jgi:hypothetical protein